MAEINKKTLEHLADLARIKLGATEEKKFLDDLKKILDHFKELEEINTEGVEPMPGLTGQGDTQLKNIFREDARLKDEKDRERETRNIVDGFPETEKGYLKIPPVFEE